MCRWALGPGRQGPRRPVGAGHGRSAVRTYGKLTLCLAPPPRCPARPAYFARLLLAQAPSLLLPLSLLHIRTPSKPSPPAAAPGLAPPPSRQPTLAPPWLHLGPTLAPPWPHLGPLRPLALRIPLLRPPCPAHPPCPTLASASPLPCTPTRLPCPRPALPPLLHVLTPCPPPSP